MKHIYKAAALRQAKKMAKNPKVTGEHIIKALLINFPATITRDDAQEIVNHVMTAGVISEDVKLLKMRITDEIAEALDQNAVTTNEVKKVLRDLLSHIDDIKDFLDNG